MAAAAAMSAAAGRPDEAARMREAGPSTRRRRAPTRGSRSRGAEAEALADQHEEDVRAP
jgi:hypothetical protein